VNIGLSCIQTNSDRPTVLCRLVEPVRSSVCHLKPAVYRSYVGIGRIPICNVGHLRQAL